MSQSCQESKIRFLHNIVNAPMVSVYLNDHLIAGNLVYKALTAYLSVDTGKYILSIKSGENVLLKKKIKINETSTIVIAGTVSEISVLCYKDDLSCPKPGYFHLRFLHVAFSVPAVDIYIGGTKIFNNVKYPYSGEPVYLPLKLGENNIQNNPAFYNISVKLAGTNTTVIGPITIYFISGGIYTIYATGAVNNNLSAILSHDNQNECEILQKDFDTQRYMGLWYQIASIPQFYDTGCVRSTAVYTLLNNKVNVYNTCIKNVSTTITGEAIAPNPCIPAALNVVFPNTPNTGINYLVHRTNYDSYAIVGSPSRLSFYILSRDKTMSKKEYHKMLSYAHRLGYNTDLIKVDQGAVKNY